MLKFCDGTKNPHLQSNLYERMSFIHAEIMEDLAEGKHTKIKYNTDVGNWLWDECLLIGLHKRKWLDWVLFKNEPVNQKLHVTGSS